MTIPEYYLIGGKDDRRENILKLSAEDIRTIEGACSALYRFGYYDKREIEIQENLKEFIKVYDIAEQDITIKTEDELSQGLFNTIFININRTFTNYLASYKIQIDHFDFHLKNKYGEDSEEYKKFEAHKKATYDANFTHRLFYHLRNYSQHVFFPLNSIVKDSIKDGSGFRHLMLVSFDKNKLLENDYISKKLGPDLKKCGDFIPVKVHIENSKRILEDIYKKYLIIEKPSLLRDVDILNKYTSIVPVGLEPLYGYWERPTPTTGVCRTTILPVDLIIKLETRLGELGLK